MADVRSLLGLDDDEDIEKGKANVGKRGKGSGKKKGRGKLIPKGLKK